MQQGKTSDLEAFVARYLYRAKGDWFVGLQGLFANYQMTGTQYFVSQKEGIVLNLEDAEGKADNYGVYLKMGYGF